MDPNKYGYHFSAVGSCASDCSHVWEGDPLKVWFYKVSQEKNMGEKISLVTNKWKPLTYLETFVFSQHLKRIIEKVVVQSEHNVVEKGLFQSFMTGRTWDFKLQKTDGVWKGRSL